MPELVATLSQSPQRLLTGGDPDAVLVVAPSARLAVRADGTQVPLRETVVAALFLPDGRIVTADAERRVAMLSADGAPLWDARPVPPDVSRGPGVSRSWFGRDVRLVSAERPAVFSLTPDGQHIVLLELGWWVWSLDGRLVCSGAEPHLFIGHGNMPALLAVAAGPRLLVQQRVYVGNAVQEFWMVIDGGGASICTMNADDFGFEDRSPEFRFEHGLDGDAWRWAGEAYLPDTHVGCLWEGDLPLWSADAERRLWLERA